MKSKLDAARLKLSTLDPATPQPTIVYLAGALELGELADLINETLRREQQLRSELAACETRLGVLNQARERKRR